MKLPAGIIRDEMHMQTQGTCGAAAMMRVEQNFLIGNSNKNRIPEVCGQFRKILDSIYCP